MLNNAFGPIRTAQAGSLYRGTFIPAYDATIKAHTWDIMAFDAQDNSKVFSDTGATTLAVDGGQVARWNKSDGSARVDYVSQSSAPLMPTYSKHAFGTNKAGIAFANDVLFRDLGSTMSYKNDWWMWIAFKRVSAWPTASRACVFSTIERATGLSYGGTASTGKFTIEMDYFAASTLKRMNLDFRIFNFVSPTYDFTSENMLLFVNHDQTGGNVEYYINGVACATTNTTSPLPTLSTLDFRTTAFGARAGTYDLSNSDVTIGGAWITTQNPGANTTALTNAFADKFGVTL